MASKEYFKQIGPLLHDAREELAAIFPDADIVIVARLHEKNAEHGYDYVVSQPDNITGVECDALLHDAAAAAEG